jgi:hypothetical protein
LTTTTKLFSGAVEVVLMPMEIDRFEQINRGR